MYRSVKNHGDRIGSSCMRNSVHRCCFGSLLDSLRISTIARHRQIEIVCSKEREDTIPGECIYGVNMPETLQGFFTGSQVTLWQEYIISRVWDVFALLSGG